MNSRIIFFFLLSVASFQAKAQDCNDSIARGCYCRDTLQNDCDLLPDITIAVKATTDSGRYVEYPPFNAGENHAFQGSDDGRFRLGIATPNIGVGPLHVTMSNLYVCGQDTFTGYPGTCANGKEPLQLIRQRVYHKKDSVMTYSEKLAGYTFFHPVHNHVHVEDWCTYSLRLKNPAEPDPLKWPILGEQNKIGFCLYNFGSCSMDSGYCRDKKDSVLYDDDFKNFYLGNYTWCDPYVQGIAPGHYDFYYKELFGMWIDIPAGTCNGNYYIVITADPFNRYNESDEQNNTVVIPVTLTKQQSPGNALAKIFPRGNTTVCQGDSVELRATAGTAYSWSTGDTVPVIWAKAPGKYAVRVTSYCGTAISDSLVVSVIPKPSPPVATGDTICRLDTAYLKAGGPADLFFWYANSNAYIPLDTGSIFKTPSLAQSRQYYVEAADSVKGKIYSGGKPDSTGRGKYLSGGNYLVFDCLYPFKLKAVTLYSKNSGFGTVEVRDPYGTAMQTKLIAFSAGKNRIVLDMDIQPEKNIQLFFSGTDDTLFVNDSLVNFPYDVPGILSVKNCNLSKKQYVYFYNWEIEEEDFYCRSSRVPVTAIVDSSCVVSVRDIGNTKPGISVWQDELQVYLKISGLNGNAGNEFSLYDITGRIIRSGFFSGEQLSVSKSQLNTGVYFFLVRNLAAWQDIQGKVLIIRN